MAGLHGLVAETVQGVAGKLAKAVEEARGLHFSSSCGAPLQQRWSGCAAEAADDGAELWREEVMRLKEEVAEWERLGDERQQ